MKRFQKVLFVLTTAVALAWVGSSTASAQTVFTASPTSVRQLRFEGITEATGGIILSVASFGTVAGAALPAGGSQIILNYGTLVTSQGDSAPPYGAAPLSAAPINCTGTLTLRTAGATIAGDATGVPAHISKTCFGNTVILTFINAAGTPFTTAGDFLQISGVRVNANFLGAGANVSVTMTPATSNPAFPIAITGGSALVTGTVRTGLSTQTTVISLNLAGNPAGSITNIALCTVQASIPLGALEVNVTEAFAEAFLSAAQEDALGSSGTGGANTAFKLRFRLSGIPKGVRVTPGLGANTVTSATLTGLVVPTPFTANEQDNEQDFDFTIGGTSLTGIESFVAAFGFTVPSLASFDATLETSATMRVWLRGASDTPATPVFSTANSSTEFNGTVLRTIVCASYLLFPWVANTGDGSVDTGMAISNTTSDTPQLNSVKQKGKVTLYFWRDTGTNNPAPKVLNAGADLEAGQTTTYVISELGAPFQGYVIAVCGFQMGHGLAAYLSGGAFNGYIALALHNPRLPAGGEESEGH